MIQSIEIRVTLETTLHKGETKPYRLILRDDQASTIIQGKTIHLMNANINEVFKYLYDIGVNIRQLKDSIRNDFCY